MSSNWAADWSRKLRNREQSSDQQNATLLERRRLLEEQGPQLWQELREAVKASAMALNDNYGDTVLAVNDKVNEVAVRLRHLGKVRDLHITFKTTSADALTWFHAGDMSPNSKSGSCSLAVDVAGRVVFKDGLNTRTPQNLAEEMLNGLLAE